MVPVYHKPLFKEFATLSVLLAALHFMAHKFSLYWSIPSFDLLMHFIGGAVASTLFLWVYFHSGIFMPQTRRIVEHFIIALLGTLFLSVVWEIFELVTGTTGVSRLEYPFDTTLDFVMDIIGGAVACLYAYHIELKERKYFDQASVLETEKLYKLLENFKK